MFGLTRKNLRHLAVLFRRGNNPAAAVYESIGSHFFLAPAPGWLNLGMWSSNGDPREAETAVRRLVERLCDPLSRGGTILDVGNGLGAQDPVIDEALAPTRLVAVNITHDQLIQGRRNLEIAKALPVVADAVSLPIASESIDGVISVEAAFHFSSRRRFFDECMRVLRPGGVISFSDFALQNHPKGLRDRFEALMAIRMWGVRADAMVAAPEIVRLLEGAGFHDVRFELVGDQVIDPALVFFRHRIAERSDVPRLHRLTGRRVIKGWERLRSRGVMDYALIHARKAES